MIHSFPRATFSENCSFLEAENGRGQMSEHIFAPNGGYLFNIFFLKECMPFESFSQLFTKMKAKRCYILFWPLFWEITEVIIS